MKKLVFKDAAELLYTKDSSGAYKERYACDALTETLKKCDTLAHDKFDDYFKPEGGYFTWYGSDKPSNRMARSLALLLCEELED